MRSRTRTRESTSEVRPTGARKASRYRTIVAVVILVLVLVVPLGAIYVNRAAEHDLEGAVERDGTATVVEIRQRASGRLTFLPASRVVVEFEGSRYQARQASGLVYLQPGKPARICYRIGRSGQVYVDRVSPL